MTSSVELAPYEGNAAPPPRADVSAVLDMAKVFVQSGFFQDVKSLSQAAVKIMAGQELGFGPFASLNGVYIISAEKRTIQRPRQRASTCRFARNGSDVSGARRHSTLRRAGDRLDAPGLFRFFRSRTRGGHVEPCGPAFRCG